MRFDSHGLFWQDDPTPTRERGPRIATPPPIPSTGWTAPFEFPRLEAAKMLCIDVETYDPNLLDKGPGWPTKDGHIVGIAVGTDDGHNWYFPMRHEYGGGNLDETMVLRWARDELTRATQPKLGTNILYDIGWLWAEDVHVAGDYHDISYAEALLDEHAFSYSLGALASKYLGETKTDDDLYDWLWRAYGGPQGRRQASNIYRAPVALVGPYAESDVDLPMRLWPKQIELLKREGLLDLYRLECDLIPILFEMRRRGVRVDHERAEITREKFIEREQELQGILDSFSGRKGFSPDAPSDMAAAFDKLGLPYPKTSAGNPSFAKHVLDKIDHPFVTSIQEMRRLLKARGTFLEGYILEKHHNGRVHGEFHPLRRDDAGTVSGRFSSSNPNLQNIPKRDKKMKKLIRGLFLPEEGDQWFAPDYSQIEYRILTHFAMGDGAEEARQRYRDDPTTDYHDMTQALVFEKTQRDMPRSPIKNINFGIVFGMGEPRITAMLGEHGKDVLSAYHEALPFVRRTLEVASQRAQTRGYIKTILGRRARFPFWECGQYYDARDRAMIEREDPDFFKYVMTREEGLKKWKRTKRARTHKALNSLTQGSGADIIKRAMVNLYKAGFPIPLVQVHDELGFSLECEGNVSQDIIYEMENAVELKVPVIVSGAWGETWGDC